MLKGVEAVAIHGSKSKCILNQYLLKKGKVLLTEGMVITAQEEREYAIKSFKSGKKDVMVASGVASKGLDFAEIQHVINFTMPGEIENYVHQIGRTGRSGKTGIATTFINMNSPEPTLLDLKYLLLEAKQRIPQFLQTIEDPNAGVNGGVNGCQFCGGTSFFSFSYLFFFLIHIHFLLFFLSGLGHSALNCPKREDSQRRERAGHHREDGAGGGY